MLQLGRRVDPSVVHPIVRTALAGPVAPDWTPPSWLWPHQRDAARRIAGALRVWRGAMLCDAVGLGKTYVALAVATRYPAVVVTAPAVLTTQWKRVSAELDVPITLVSHESLSRGTRPPAASLVVVDEAHRFRNPLTRRYDTLARAIGGAEVLLLTATPVVNRPADLVTLLRLWLPDHGLALFGLPSLERAGAGDDLSTVASAVANIIVSRSADTAGIAPGAIPSITDGPVTTRGCMPHEQLVAVEAGIQSLRFPTFAGPQAAELLRLHLLYRLSSSVAACRETVQRHLRYIDRALDAARHGRTLRRRDVRLLFGLDDSQLSLALQTGPHPSGALDTTVLHRDRTVLENVRAHLDASETDPKVEALVHLLSRNRGGKTVVFTTAVATAHRIARRLQWHRLAVATGSGARIASTTLTLEDVLALFAPRARSAPAPPRCAPVDLLIATDLLSEGVNLQDAQTVVHYDLPWTPLRLQQRIGRLARLGSAHDRVDVHWFAPCPVLEQRLRLRTRIDRKVGIQSQLGVAVSTRVGRANVLGQAFEERERLACLAHIADVEGGAVAVVRGAPAAVFVVRWSREPISVPAVLVFAGQPLRPVRDLRIACDVIRRLLDATPSARPPNAPFTAVLGREVRARLGRAIHGSSRGERGRLTRIVLHQGRRAAAARRWRELEVLDRVLQQLSAGIPAGAGRDLTDAATASRPGLTLRRWLTIWERPSQPVPEPTLEAVLVADGSG